MRPSTRNNRVCRSLTGAICVLGGETSTVSEVDEPSSGFFAHGVGTAMVLFQVRRRRIRVAVVDDCFPLTIEETVFSY